MEPQLTEALFASFIAKSGQLEIIPLSRCLKLNPCARPVGPGQLIELLPELLL